MVELVWNYRSASRADAGKVGMTEREVDGKAFGCRYRGTDDHATRGPLYQEETPQYARAV